MLRFCFFSYDKIEYSCYVNPNLAISSIVFGVFMLSVGTVDLQVERKIPWEKFEFSSFHDPQNQLLVFVPASEHKTIRLMSVKCTGVRAKIKGIDKFTPHTPCSTHSLNLISLVCLQVVAFVYSLSKIEKVYASTQLAHIAKI